MTHDYMNAMNEIPNLTIEDELTTDSSTSKRQRIDKSDIIQNSNHSVKEVLGDLLYQVEEIINEFWKKHSARQPKIILLQEECQTLKFDVEDQLSINDSIKFELLDNVTKLQQQIQNLVAANIYTEKNQILKVDENSEEV